MLNQVIQGDCLELLPLVPSGSVDMVLCDLPYGTTACKWDSVIPFAPLWEQYKRVLKPGGVVALTASQPFTTDVIMSNREWFRYCWVWDKKKPGAIGSAKYQPLRVTEDVVIFYKDAGNYNPQLVPREKPKTYRNYKHSEINQPSLGAMTENRVTDFLYPKNIIEISNADQRNKVHPTQKPVALWEYLIRTYTNEGDTVLDNCCGSGTTGVACRNTGRNFIQMEKDPKYCEIARQRLSSEAQSLFA